MIRVIIMSLVLSWLLLPPFLDDSKAEIGTFSLELKENSLEEVGSMFHERTGYEISFPDVYYSMNVSGRYENTSLENFLSRILRGTNYASVVDDNNKLVIVTIYGKNVASVSDNTNISDGSFNHASDQFDEFERIVAQNVAEYQDFINNPESRDPSSSLTFSQIRDLSKTAENEILSIINNPESQDPFSGRPIGEIQEAARNGEEALQTFLANPDSVEPLSGIKISEIRNKAKRQEAEIEKYLEKKRLN